MPKLLDTLWRNAFGSDELEHYTAEYTWMANQMSHAMMGFFLAVFVVLVSRFVWALKTGSKPIAMSKLAPPGGPMEPAPAPTAGPATAPGGLWRTDLAVGIMFALIILKEAVDITSDAIRYSGTKVSTNFGNIYLDSFTDTMFWWSGMFLALLGLNWLVFAKEERRKWRNLITIAGPVFCLALGLGTGQVWVNQKRTFDRSGMPGDYERLNRLLREQADEPDQNPNLRPIRFRADKADQQYAWLKEFQAGAGAEGKVTAQHYLLKGGRPQDRSRLAVSMGCEYAFKLRFRDWRAEGTDLTRVYFVSAVKALEDPSVFVNETAANKLECVIINDLDVTLLPPLKLLDIDKLSPTHTRRIAALAGPEALAATKAALLSDAFPDLASPEFVDAVLLLTAQNTLNEVKKAPPGKVPAGVSDDVKRVVERQEVLIQLGINANKEGIHTIWVMAGDGKTGDDRKADDPEKKRARGLWQQDYDAWKAAMAKLLGVAEDDLREIEILQPDEK
jgi:hypothetical protein